LNKKTTECYGFLREDVTKKIRIYPLHDMLSRKVVYFAKFNVNKQN